MSKKPVIDGDIDEPFWRNEKFSFYTLKDMVTGKTPDHISTKASFRWIRDKDNPALVVAIDCKEPNMANLSEGCTDRDSMTIFTNDSVEIQLQTPAGITPKIVITPRGAIYDYCATDEDADLPYMYTIEKFAVKKYENRWTVEAVIPAKKISGEKPNKDYAWGVNICRQRMAGNTTEHYMLSPSGSNFKDKKCMGNLFMRQ